MLSLPGAAAAASVFSGEAGGSLLHHRQLAPQGKFAP